DYVFMLDKEGSRINNPQHNNNEAGVDIDSSMKIPGDYQQMTQMIKSIIRRRNAINGCKVITAIGDMRSSSSFRPGILMTLPKGFGPKIQYSGS
ncbi:3120_t:CDS:2, partial [Funneliformis mosseae]